ncbi:hypothetical protein BN1723_013714, partial [Verticillium longisporum]
MKSYVVAILASFASQAAAHSTFQQLWCARLPPSNSPVEDVTSTNIVCNVGGTSGRGGKCPVKAGGTVTVEMHAQNGDRNCANEAIGGNHFGPVIVYLSKVSDASTADGSSGWFKIHEDGWSAKSGSTKADQDNWGVKDLNACCGRMDVRIPADLENGDYLLRAEVVALHVASQPKGAQTRCDGGKPCASCQSRSRDCQYRPSRRGGARIRKKQKTCDELVQQAELFSLEPPQEEVPSQPISVQDYIDPGAGLKQLQDVFPDSDFIFDSLFMGMPEEASGDSTSEASLGFASLTVPMVRTYRNNRDILDAYYVFLHQYLPVLPPPTAVPIDQPIPYFQNSAEAFETGFEPSTPITLAICAILALSRARGARAAVAPPAPTAGAPPAACSVPQFQQCGGQDYKGCTVCASPYTCKAVSPPYYSQCT